MNHSANRHHVYKGPNDKLVLINMDEVEKWTRHFKLMAEGKLHKDPKGYYIVNPAPNDQMGGTESSLDSSSILDKIPERYKYKVGAILGFIIKNKQLSTFN